MNSFPPCIARTLCALLVGLTLWTAPLQAAKKPAPPNIDGPVVELSPFEVTAQSVEFENWNKYVSPHYITYTDASPKEATEVMRHMEMLRQAIQYFFRRQGLQLPPTILVLPTGRSDWRKIQSRGKVEWQVAASAVGTTRELVLLQYDWQSDGLNSLWAMLGIRETARMNMDGPLWFTRGVADYFRTVVFKGNALTIGKQGGDAAWIRLYGWMDWEKFFGVTIASPEFKKDSRDHDQFEGQCGVLTHYALTNPDPAWTLHLLSWAACLSAGNRPTEENFREVFHTDWKGLQDSIDKMLSGGTYQSSTLTFPPAAMEFTIEREHISPREMRELFVLSQILNQDTKDSESSLDALLKRGLKTDALRELLVDACDQRHRPEAELHQLRDLIANNSTNPAVYAEAANILFKKAVPQMSLDVRLGDEAEEIDAWCKRALELEPLYAEADETLAWTEALSPKVEPVNLQTIGQICRRLGGNAKTDAALTAYAIARWRAGDSQQARSLAEKLKESIYTRTSAKELVTELIARIDAAGLAR